MCAVMAGGGWEGRPAWKLAAYCTHIARFSGALEMLLHVTAQS